MAQRPTVRTDVSEKRHDDGPPPVDAAPPRQRDNRPFESLSIRVSGKESSLTNLDEILRLIAEQACLATAATASAIALRWDNEIICRATAGPNTPDLGVPLNISSGLSGACVRSREPQYCEDTETDPGVNAEACRRLQVRSVMIVPLLKSGELLGVFEIFSPQPQAFARHDLQNLNALANVVLDSLQTETEPATTVPIDPAPMSNPALAPAAETPADKVVVRVPEVAKSLEKPAVAETAPPKKISGPEKEGRATPEVRVSEKVPESKTQVARAETPIERLESLIAQVEAPVARFDVPVAPVRSSASNAPSPASAKKPPASRATERPTVQIVPPQHAASSREESQASSSGILSITNPQKPVERDWTSTLLTVAVVTLAVVLGWMLGRAGWERAVGGGKTRASSAASPGATQVHSAESSGADEGDPIVVDTEGRANRASPAGVTHAPAGGASSPPSTSAPAGADSNGGLVVYEGGKVIFQQTSPSGSFARPTSVESDGTPAVAPIAVPSQLASAHLIERVEPIYPEEARARFIQGEVVLEAVVGRDGKVQELKLISGEPHLAAAAATAVRQWRFRPYEQHGKASDFSTRFTVNFRLH